MLSAKLLIVAVVLTYGAVLIYSECEITSEICSDADISKTKNLAMEAKKCHDLPETGDKKKTEENKMKCQRRCELLVLGTDYGAATLNHRCQIDHLENMANGTEKDCCQTILNYFKDCYINLGA